MNKERIATINFKILNEIAFKHTTYLSKCAVNLDREGVRSIPYLLRILKAEPADVYETLIETFATTKEDYGGISFPNITPAVNDCYIIWGRMYVIAYFALYEEVFWRKVVLPKIYDMTPNNAIRNEMNIAAKHIDTYNKDRENWLQSFIEAGAPAADDFAFLVERKELQQKIADLEEQIKHKDAELAQKNARIADLEKRDNTAIKLSGRPKTVLFEDATDCQKEKELLLSYLKKHNFSSTAITSEKDNTLTNIIAVFYWHWQKKYHIKAVNASAYYRFLRETCQLKFDITEKTFANVMGKILRNKTTYPNITGEVNEFIQRNSTQEIL